jgi:hypothetical protein
LSLFHPNNRHNDQAHKRKSGNGRLRNGARVRHQVREKRSGRDSIVAALDNSEGFWGAEGSYPIIDLFEQEGFMRVDFCGFAPGFPGATTHRYSSGTMRAYSAA